MKTFMNSLYMTVVFLVICGIIFPVVLTGIGNLFFPYQSEGSLIKHNSIVIGSKLIGQDFSGNQNLFQGNNSSSSGVDPEITLSNAHQQAITISKNTGISLTQLEHIIQESTTSPQCVIFGSSCMNVLLANIELKKIEK